MDFATATVDQKSPTVNHAAPKSDVAPSLEQFLKGEFQKVELGGGAVIDKNNFDKQTMIFQISESECVLVYDLTADRYVGFNIPVAVNQTAAGELPTLKDLYGDGLALNLIPRQSSGEEVKSQISKLLFGAARCDVVVINKNSNHESVNEGLRSNQSEVRNRTEISCFNYGYPPRSDGSDKRHIVFEPQKRVVHIFDGSYKHLASHAVFNH